MFLTYQHSAKKKYFSRLLIPVLEDFLPSVSVIAPAWRSWKKFLLLSKLARISHIKRHKFCLLYFLLVKVSKRSIESSLYPFSFSTLLGYSGHGEKSHTRTTALEEYSTVGKCIYGVRINKLDILVAGRTHINRILKDL